MSKESKELQVIYEDNHIMVVIKPNNIPTQADESNDIDMLTIIREYLKEKYNKQGNVYVGLVHRLDRPTGGVMVFAKTSKSASRLSEQIKTGEFSKKYLAVVNGVPEEDSMVLTNYLKKNPRTNTVSIVSETMTGAKLAKLQYKLLKAKEKVSLLDIELYTGRGHQIRVQLMNIGHPIYGDVKYGGDILAKGHNLALWAYELRFEHPTLKTPMVFKVYPPEVVPFNVFDIKNLV